MQGEETIAAIATGLGEGGVGVIRISGMDAIGVAERCFRPRAGVSIGQRRSHMAVFGTMVGPAGEVVDEGLALPMKGPRSYTGEDVVELHCHGGQVAVRRVLDAALAAGARLAEPGEFTKRAFLNGRIDLSQAEAVVDIIRAKTDRAMSAAVSQLRGELGGAVRAVRDRLLETMAHLEADIDFPELDLEVQTRDEVERNCRWGLEQVRSLLAGARQGKLLREGLRVVLVGRPNVGKSSLMNRLVRENRSIVTEIPGTTRDVVEDWVNIRGLPISLADTAGIRETSDRLEQLGVERSRSMIEKADLLLVVIDASAGIADSDRELIDLLPTEKLRIGVVNKLDLAPGFRLAEFAGMLAGASVLGVSAQSGAGMDELEVAISAAAGSFDAEEGFIATARHEQCLRLAGEHLEAALGTMTAGLGSDLISIDIRSAWAVLGEITGETVGEDLLDQIFSRFCIGK